MGREFYIVADVYDLLLPETDYERVLLSDPELMLGMLSGEPRYGHPEGKVFLHVREVMDNIDKLAVSAAVRAQLRIIAIVHDSFKHLEHKGTPRDWTRHHAVLARKFLDHYTREQAILIVTEVHDEAYYCWRMQTLEGQGEAAAQRLHELLWTLGPFLQLFYLFFLCDTRTGDKTQAPVRWFEENIEGIVKVSI